MTEIWHNPRCSKSRETLKLLQDAGEEPEIRLYLETPPDKEELERVLAMLGKEPRDLMRLKEADYRANNLGDPSLSRADLIDAMTRHPKLIERPVVIKDGKAALGRPPEKVLEVL